MANELWDDLSLDEQDDEIIIAITAEVALDNDCTLQELLDALAIYEVTKTDLEANDRGSITETVFPTNGPPQKPIRW